MVATVGGMLHPIDDEEEERPDPNGTSVSVRLEVRNYWWTLMVC